jgi:hypothetical protein
MPEYIPIERHEDQELPVPTQWRDALRSIVNCFAEGEFRPDRKISGVLPLAPEDASDVEKSIKAYGGKMVKLPLDSWNMSFYQATQGGWQVWIYLYTENEAPSDLVLFVFVRVDGSSFTYEIESVHVP